MASSDGFETLDAEEQYSSYEAVITGIVIESYEHLGEAGRGGIVDIALNVLRGSCEWGVFRTWSYVYHLLIVLSLIHVGNK